jgi:hypothetical protein
MARELPVESGSVYNALSIAGNGIEKAQDELRGICNGALDSNDRAAVCRAKYLLLGAVARLGDVERLTRPPAVHNHPGGPPADHDRTVS